MDTGERSDRVTSYPLAALRSAVPGLAWPAVPTPDGARLLALLRQLDESQWWPAERLHAAQTAQLNLLLEHAARSVPFYQERLAAAGYAPGTRLSDEIWSRIPILTRQELNALDGPIESTQLPPGHRELKVIKTSGSTGRPVQAQTTETTRLFWNAITLRDHLLHKRDFSAKLAVIRIFDHAKTDAELRAPNWGLPAALLFETGPTVGLSVHSTTEQQAAWLLRERPAYLLSFASAVKALAEHFIANKLSLPELREVRTLAEVVTPELRALCREAWGVKLVDIYSAQEAGYFALQCPEQEHYHVQSEVVRLEVLDDTGAPVAPGGVGRVVVTPLHNFASPLLRYEIGDLAELGAPCPCGRGQPVLTRIMGRTRNMLILPDGGRIWPGFRGSALSSLAPVRQFQIVQKNTERLEVHLAADRPLTPEEEKAIAEEITARVGGHRFDFAFFYHEEIPRSAGGKYEDFKSEIAAVPPLPARVDSE